MTTSNIKSFEELAINILEDGIIDAEEVKLIRERIYEDGIIDREEADFLFKLNDGASGANNDPSWKALFTEAITDHVLKDEISPDVLDADEADYLINKIKADGIVDDVELALLVNIVANAKECTDSFNAFVLESLKTAILEDGIIDADEVEMIRTVIYGTGSGEGEGVDRSEADFLFDLNDATSGKENAPAWKNLFVEALAKHVLEDETSPGEIDEDEAEWLIKRIEGDDKYDNNEKALLTYIKTHAKKIHSELQVKIDFLKL